MRELFLPEPGPGARMRWLDLPGDGVPRVYVHGLGCTAASDFAHITPRRQLAGHRSLLVDLFGHGFSDRPHDFGYGMADQAAAVAAVLDHEELRGVELVGHSMGGAVAIELAASRPDLVSRLVVAEPNLFPGGGFLSSAIAAQDEREFAARGFADLIARQRLPGYAARMRLADPVALHRSAVALREGSTPSWGELLIGLDRPRAFLVGARSRPDEEADRMAAAGVPVFEVPEAGHNMMTENPDGFAAALATALSVS